MCVKESKSVYFKLVRQANIGIFQYAPYSPLECSGMFHSHIEDVTTSYVQLSGHDDTFCLKTFHPELD